MTTQKKHQLLYVENHIRMEISEISYGSLDPSWNFKNLRAAFTRIYLPLRGMGRISYGNTTVELLPGHIYVIPAGLSFSCSCPKVLDKIFIHLTLTHPNGSDVFSGISSCLILEDLDSTAERIAELCEHHDVSSILNLKLLLYGILDRALKHSNSEQVPIKEYSECTKAALAYIDAHLCAGLSIGEIASSLFVSKLALQKHFKKDVEKPLGTYIDSCLMARAERLLLNQELTIKEISEKLGFCDQFYFSRRFSESHGISPSSFRKAHRV